MKVEDKKDRNTVLVIVAELRTCDPSTKAIYCTSKGLSKGSLGARHTTQLGYGSVEIDDSHMVPLANSSYRMSFCVQSRVDD